MTVSFQPEIGNLQPVATSNSEVMWAREQSRAHAAFAKWTKRIASAAASGNRKTARAAVRAFLRSDLAKLSAVLRAMGGSPNRQTAMSICRRVNPWARSYPLIGWQAQPKSSGGFRPVCKGIPVELMAVHYMIAAALEAQFEPSVPLYGVKNYSRDDVARALKALQNEGFVYLAKTDIRDCYQNVSSDALYELPLLTEVIRHALDTRHLNFEEMRGEPARLAACTSYLSSIWPYAHVASGPRGLMQGSPASPVILAWMLNGIPTGTDDVVLLCHDNIVVASRHPAGSRATLASLFAHFEQHPAGPFALCTPTFADSEPLEFLGYLFDPSRRDIGIGEKGRSSLERHLAEADEADVMELYRCEMEHRAFTEMFPHTWHRPFVNCFPVHHWRALIDFRSGFSAADENGEELAFYLATTEEVVERRGEPLMIHLHQNLFAPRHTPEGRELRAILKRHPRQR